MPDGMDAVAKEGVSNVKSSALRGADGQIVASRMAIGGVGRIAHCPDTEDNLLGIKQEDPAPR